MHKLHKTLHKTDAHHHDAEPGHAPGRMRLPVPPPGQLDVAGWRHDVGQGAGTGGADKLEHDAEVAGDERDGRGANN